MWILLSVALQKIVLNFLSIWKCYFCSEENLLELEHILKIISFEACSVISAGIFLDIIDYFALLVEENNQSNWF